MSDFREMREELAKQAQEHKRTMQHSGEHVRAGKGKRKRGRK